MRGSHLPSARTVSLHLRGSFQDVIQMVEAIQRYDHTSVAKANKQHIIGKR
jgi:hypothetical protein